MSVVTVCHGKRHAVFHAALDKEHRRQCFAFMDALKISRDVLVILR
jgi:hypothetical protein